MNKTQITSLTLLLILTVGGFTLSGCSGPKPKVEEAEPETQPHVDLVQLNPEAVRQSGIQVFPVTDRAIAHQIQTTGEVKANENRVFHINSFVSGRVVRDNALIGDYIQRGQTIAVVQNLDVARVQADYIHQFHQNEIDIHQSKTRLSLAQKNLEREKRLLAEGISPRKDYLQAQTDTELARSDLEGKQEHAVHLKSEATALLGAYGMKPGNIHSETIRTGSPLTALQSGVVTKKNITLGDVVTPDQTLYEVADLSQLWLDITVYPKDLPEVRPGQRVSFTSDSLPGQTFVGRINYIPPAASEQTQTFIARAYLENPQGRLRPGMFGQVAIQEEGLERKPYLPEEAIQKYGKETFVFIDLGQGKFRKQNVQLGEKVSGGYLINQGIQAGDRIVGKGSFRLKSELLKSEFGEEE